MQMFKFHCAGPAPWRCWYCRSAAQPGVIVTVSMLLSASTGAACCMWEPYTLSSAPEVIRGLSGRGLVCSKGTCRACKYVLEIRGWMSMPYLHLMLQPRVVHMLA